MIRRILDAGYSRSLRRYEAFCHYFNFLTVRFYSYTGFTFQSLIAFILLGVVAH